MVEGGRGALRRPHLRQCPAQARLGPRGQDLAAPWFEVRAPRGVGADEALDLRVERLVRTKFGPVKLGSLESGKTRSLTARENEIISALSGSGDGSKTIKRGSRRDTKRRNSR